MNKKQFNKIQLNDKQTKNEPNGWNNNNLKHLNTIFIRSRYINANQLEFIQGNAKEADVGV